MTGDLRRYLLSLAEAAADRTSFTVTAGTLILGALLSPAAKAAGHLPPINPAPADRDSQPIDPGPHAAAANPAAASDVLHHLEDRPPDVVQSAGFVGVDPDGAANPLASPAFEQGSGVRHIVDAAESLLPDSAKHSPVTPDPAPNPAATQTFDGQAEPSHSSGLPDISNGLAADLQHVVDSLLNSALNMSGLWQQTLMTLDHTVATLGSTVESIPVVPAVEQMGANLIHDIGSSVGDAVNAATTQLTSAVEHGATLLDGLPSSLLGTTGGSADGVLTQAFGTGAPQPGLSANDAIGHSLVATTAASPVTVGFMGQSYTEAFDSHDVSHQSFHSLLHGLV